MEIFVQALDVVDDVFFAIWHLLRRYQLALWHATPGRRWRVARLPVRVAEHFPRAIAASPSSGKGGFL
jgi:hypothetical protein